MASNLILTKESAQAAEERLTSSYSAIAVDDNASSSTQIGIGLINGIIIIGVITLMTFLVVLLYYFNCIWFLKGYMAVAFMFLLGYFGSQMFLGAINRYDLWVTYISFALLMWNVTFVGIYSIFYGTGVPVYIGQGYLILVSVILAWELSHFSEMLAWILLCLLALYDLFAVLTPCGPLKALVKLMNRDGAPELPALMYEAQLSAGARRQSPAEQQSQQESQLQQQEQQQQQQTQERQEQHQPQEQSHQDASNTDDALRNENVNDSTSTSSKLRPISDSTQEEKKNEDSSDANIVRETTTEASENRRGISQQANQKATNESVLTEILRPPHAESGNNNNEVIVSTPSEEVVRGTSQDEIEMISRPTGTIPLAIAKLYKIPLVAGESATRTMLEAHDLTPEQLLTMVDVVYPRNGGRMERVPDPIPEQPSEDTTSASSGITSLFQRRRRRQPSAGQQPPDQRPKYNVIGRDGTIRRTIYVGENGRVYRVLNEAERQQREEEEQRKMPNSIRLGLGDFIFYSVLVSKASLFSFTTFAVCVLAILVGLLLTLVLLAIRGKALPALPISICFGVLFYLPTRFVIRPWIEGMFIQEVYV